MILAVDFDGTIVEHRFPAIGKERLFAFETLKAANHPSRGATLKILPLPAVAPLMGMGTFGGL